MRTDGLQISEEALVQVRDAVAANFGPDYVPKAARIYKYAASCRLCGLHLPASFPLTRGLQLFQSLRPRVKAIAMRLSSFYAWDAYQGCTASPSGKMQQPWFSEPVGRSVSQTPMTLELLNCRSKAKNAQEAHEAVRPTRPALLPAAQAARLAPRSPLARLYELIWRRTAASQMADARIMQARVARRHSLPGPDDKVLIAVWDVYYQKDETHHAGTQPCCCCLMVRWWAKTGLGTASCGGLARHAGSWPLLATLAC